MLVSVFHCPFSTNYPSEHRLVKISKAFFITAYLHYTTPVFFNFLTTFQFQIWQTLSHSRYALKLDTVKKLTIVNGFVFHTLHRTVTRLAVITRKTTKKEENIKGGGKWKTAHNPYYLRAQYHHYYHHWIQFFWSGGWLYVERGFGKKLKVTS